MSKAVIPPASRHMIYYGLGLFMMKGISLIMLPILAHTFSIEQIGKLELLATISAFASIMIGFSMNEILYRFTGHLDDSEKKTCANKIYILSLTISVGFLPLTLMLSTFIAQQVDTIQPHELMILCSGLLIEATIGVSLAWLRMQDKVTHFVWVTTGTSLLQITLILIFVWLDTGVAGVLASSVLAHFCQFIVLHKINAFTWQLPSISQCKTFLYYSVPLTLSGLLAFSLNGFEKWILSSSSSLSELAVYAIATKFALAMCILVQPFGMWWMPKRFHHLEQKGVTSTTTTTQYGMVWIVILSSTMAYVAPAFIQLFMPLNYYLATDYVLMAIGIAMLKEISELTNIGILHRKQTRVLLIINIMAATIAISLALALKSYSVWGILTAMFIAQFFRTVAITLLSQYYLRLTYRYLSLGLLFMTSFTHLVVSYHVESIHYLMALTLFAPLTILVLVYFMRMLPIPAINTPTISNEIKSI